MARMHPDPLLGLLMRQLRRDERPEPTRVAEVIRNFEGLPPDFREYAAGLIERTIKPKRGRKPENRFDRWMRDLFSSMHVEELRAKGKTYEQALEIAAENRALSPSALHKRLLRAKNSP